MCQPKVIVYMSVVILSRHWGKGGIYLGGHFLARAAGMSDFEFKSVIAGGRREGVREFGAGGG